MPLAERSDQDVAGSGPLAPVTGATPEQLLHQVVVLRKLLQDAAAPLEGAGRVEDTINLLWHAARKIVEGMVLLLESDKETVCPRRRRRRRVSDAAQRHRTRPALHASLPGDAAVAT